MEELFQYMKTLRSQINDVADQAAKTSVEEHMQSATIQNLQTELDSVKNETKQVKEEADRMAKEKSQICSQILEKQRKIAALESDSYTRCQTLELMRQERSSLSARLVDQSAHYKKVNEDISGQLKQQQEWVEAQKFGSQTRESIVSEKAPGTKEFRDDTDLQAAQARFDKMEQLNSSLVLENAKLRQAVELVKTKMTDFRPELMEMDEKRLQEGLQELLSYKATETEHLQSMEHQIMSFKEYSHTIVCTCGKEYTVKLDK